MIASILFAAITPVLQQFSALPLDAALQQAVATSPDVTQAREHVNENAALLAAARGNFAPQLTANYAQSPQAGNTGNTVLQKLTTVGGQITLGDYFGYEPAIREAQANLVSAQFDLLNAQRTEREKVANEYFDALQSVATVQLREHEVTSAQSDFNAAQIRFRTGDAPRLDVVRAQVALTQANADLDSANVDMLNAEQALAIETGVSPDTLSQTLAEPSASTPPLGNVRFFCKSPEGVSLSKLQKNARVGAPQGSGATSVSPTVECSRLALSNRGDYQAALANIQAEQAAVATAQRLILPAITVGAGYTNGIDTGALVHGPSANVQFNLPLSNVTAQRVTAERARLAQAQAKAESIRRQITVAVAAAARTYAASGRALQAATQARIAAEEELHATEIGYRSGATSSLDVADARRTYEQAALTELTALYAQAKASAILEQEIGP